jgi:hypothetical protein
MLPHKASSYVTFRVCRSHQLLTDPSSFPVRKGHEAVDCVAARVSFGRATWQAGLNIHP